MIWCQLCIMAPLEPETIGFSAWNHQRVHDFAHKLQNTRGPHIKRVPGPLGTWTHRTIIECVANLDLTELYCGFWNSRLAESAVQDNSVFLKELEYQG